jgi:hypothetical protein
VKESKGGNLSLGVKNSKSYFAQDALLGVPSARTVLEDVVVLAEKWNQNTESSGRKKLCVNASSKVKSLELLLDMS